MSGLRLARMFGAAITVALALAGQAHAGDSHMMGGGLPQGQLKRLVEQQARLESLDNSDAARGLYSRLAVWPPSYTMLRVCFFGGSSKTNAAVAKVAQEWITDDVGLKLDFGKQDRPRKCSRASKLEHQIRVSYELPGQWSHTGQGAVIMSGQREASLNLEAFDKMDPAELGRGNERAAILHVFGHALGLFDEHQNSNSICENEFNWSYIHSYFAEGTFIMPVEVGGYKKKTGADIVATDFDPKSIMLEPLPEKFFLKGADSPCFIKQYNPDISAVDHATLAGIYPAKGTGRRDAFETNKAAFEKIVDKAGEQERKAVARGLMKALFDGK